MGIGVFLKSVLPLTFYLGALFFSLTALTGKTKWALYLVVFLLPLRNVIDKLQAFPFGDQLIDILIIGIFVGTMIKVAIEKNTPPIKSPLNSLGLSMIIYLIISWAWGSMYVYGGVDFSFQNERLQDCKNICLLPLLYYLVSKNIRTKQEVWNIFAIICCSIFVVAYYTTTQIFTYSSLESRLKITSTFQFLGPNEAAAFLNTYTLIMISSMYFLKSKRLKLILLGFIVVNIFCITFLYSRAGYAALLAGLTVLFAIKDKKMLIPIFIVLVSWQSVLPEKVIARIKETKNEAGELDESSGKRIQMWENAVSLFQQSPLLGTGFGTFREMGYELKDTHNIYMKILSEQGLIGILLFLALLISFMREGFKLYQKGDDDFARGLGLGLFVSIFAVATNNIFGDRWTYLEPNAFLWIFAALVARSNSLIGHVMPVTTQRPSKPKTTQEPDKPKKIRYYDPS